MNRNISLFGAWRRSFYYFISGAHLRKLVVRTLRKSWPLILLTLSSAVALLVWVSCFSELYSSRAFMRVLSLPVPVISIALSIIYVPYLVFLHADPEHKKTYGYYRTQARIALLYYIALLGGVGAVVGLFYWLPEIYHVVLVGLIGLLLVGFSLFMCASPFIMLIYSYTENSQSPDSSNSYKKGFWMTVCEAPALVLAMLLVSPIGLGIYWWGQLDVSVLVSRLGVHVISILYWEFSWSIMMALYQERKALYS